LASINRIAGRLRNLRKLSGKSLRELEAATGISNPLLSQIENGKVKEPGIFKVAKLAEFYGFTIEQLISR
jgi:transcriptional regulator with XRE-family HTH domain